MQGIDGSEGHHHVEATTTLCSRPTLSTRESNAKSGVGVSKVTPIDQRVSLITLGMRDVATSRAFYERLVWRVGLDVEETVFFQIGGAVQAVWGRDTLEQDSSAIDSGGWGDVTLG